MAKNELACSGLGKSRFVIRQKDWLTLQAWAKLAHDKDGNEISGMLCVLEIKPKVYILTNPEILQQENTGHTTKLDADACAEYYTKYGVRYDSKKVRIGKESFTLQSDIRYCWWHSHHTMSAFWSSTDENEIEQWQNSSWSLALVINLAEEYQFRINVWEPIVAHADVRLQIIRDSKVKITKEMEEQYEELCSNPTKANHSWNDDVLSYNNSYNVGKVNQTYIPGMYQTTLINDNNVDLMNCMSILEDVASNFVTGEIDYATFKKEVEELNKNMKEEKIGFKIKVLNEQKLWTHLQHKDLSKLITKLPKGGNA
tara:strand:+ start:4833 stop:5771 length:939 start_codon:yes stop_codon:yes gene_type:complete